MEDQSKYNSHLEKNKVASFKDIPVIIFTFVLVLFAWIFFKADSLAQALLIVKKIIFDFSISEIDLLYPKRFLIIVLLVAFEWFQRDKEHPLAISGFPKWLRYFIYAALVLAILFFGTFNYAPFIYFQF